jgi:signal transduction histidine kinase
VGFDSGSASQLFSPFHRMHRQDEFEGTGIGLANVKRIVERHGGSVTAESKPGAGAVFSVTLPE